MVLEYGLVVRGVHRAAALNPQVVEGGCIASPDKDLLIVEELAVRDSKLRRRRAGVVWECIMVQCADRGRVGATAGALCALGRYALPRALTTRGLAVAFLSQGRDLFPQGLDFSQD